MTQLRPDNVLLDQCLPSLHFLPDHHSMQLLATHLELSPVLLQLLLILVVSNS